MPAAKKFDYKQKRRELDELVARLQSDELSVDESLALYEKGCQLIDELEAYLKTAQNTLSSLKS